MSGMTFSGTVLGTKDDKKATKKNAGVQNGEEEGKKDQEERENDSETQQKDSAE
ncbi:hypothetical protein GYMLUDRAFT_32540, partial [Collybiopsis luxurians FD-317 M1]